MFHLAWVSGLLLSTFLIHFSWIQTEDQPVLIVCYAFNWIWTLVFLAAVYFVSEKQRKNLGFLFLYTSLAKFGLFLFLIKPMLTLDQGVRSEHFIFFFIPYAISMVYETVCTVRTLNAK